MAQRVVDGLEVVEVEEQDGRHLATSTSTRQGVLDAVGEQGPVGEPGQWVVECLVAELGLEFGPVRHVMGVDDEPTDRRDSRAGSGRSTRRPASDRRHARTGIRPTTSAPGRSAIDSEMSRERLGVVRVDRTRERLADVPVHPPAEDPLDGDALVVDDAIPVDDEDEVRRVLDEGAEARLTVGERAGEVAQSAVLAPEPA